MPFTRSKNIHVQPCKRFYLLLCTIVEAAFFAKTKEPSPGFGKVAAEKVVGLNAKDNS